MANSEYSKKSFNITLILFIFFCYFGAHNLYLGKFKSFFYIILLQLIGFLIIALKAGVILHYYPNTIYGSHIFLNIFGSIGYICFIIVFITLIKDLINLFSNKLVDGNNKIVTP